MSEENIPLVKQRLRHQTKTNDIERNIASSEGHQRLSSQSSAARAAGQIIRARSFGITAVIDDEKEETNGYHAVDPLEKKPLKRKKSQNPFLFALGQVPAVALGTLLNLMWAVPFGVSYFPVEWRKQELGPLPEEEAGSDKFGMFPLPGKDALGIRIFIFSTMLGQLIFTYASGFTNPMGMQMIENVPFCHALAFICIAEQGWGVEALSTLFFLFGASSVFVGAVFFFLGWLELGKVVYFIPTHVLLGCIAGIGVFIVQVSVEVTIGEEFTWTITGFKNCINNFSLLAPVLGFYFILKVIMHFTRLPNGHPKYPLLPPIYFCMITPLFYLGMLIFRVHYKDAQTAGFFFPSIDSCDPSTDDCEVKSALATIFNVDLLDMWRVIDLRNISWVAVGKSIPTLIGLTAFSLIHVPINIPAFAVSTGVEADMNNEMKAHGYSNALSGILFGLQNYLCYSNSMAYAKSKGEGKMSSLALTILTAALFFIGPSIASYVPCCMAGALLVHLGVELFMEGAYDSYGNYDSLEYFSIWLIIIIMTAFGMSAALVAGAVTAVATFSVQSINSMSPVRGALTAETLRGSRMTLSREAYAILDDKKSGRSNVFVIQLQGHLFFGNITQLTDDVKRLLKQKEDAGEDIWIVILDFSHVVGIDTSAAQAIGKLKDMMHKQQNIALLVYVSGPSGFPCQFDLARHLTAPPKTAPEEQSEPSADLECMMSPRKFAHSPYPGGMKKRPDKKTLLKKSIRRSLSVTEMPEIPSDKVCMTLDLALMFSEDVLIALENPALLEPETEVKSESFEKRSQQTQPKETAALRAEKENALRYLSNLCRREDDDSDVNKLFALLERQIYKKNQIVWRQGSKSDCAKLVVKGELRSTTEGEGDDTVELLTRGMIIGEFGLVNGADRLSTVECVSDEAVLYTLELHKWSKLVEEDPKVARCMDMIAVRHLAHRVQQVSSRIFETRTLPI